MTQIEELLRSVLAETVPAPPIRTLDPLDDLGRRIGRARRRIAAFSVAGVVVVVAAIVVPISLAGSGQHRRGPIATVHQPVRQEWSREVNAVTVGGGSAWTLEEHSTKSATGNFVVQRNLASGAIERRYPIGEVQDSIAYGLNRVWVWGGALESGGLHPSERITALNPTTGARITTSLAAGLNFGSVAFADGSAWAPVHKHGLLRLRLSGDRIAVSTLPLGNSRWVVPISSQGVVVGTANGGLDEAPTSDLVKRVVAGLTMLAPAPGYGVWTVADRELTYTARFGSPSTLSLHASDQVVAVAGSPETGVYVGLENNEDALNNPYLDYYSAEALRGAHPHPTARLLGTRQVSQIVLDPAGGVLITDYDQQLLHWDPTS